MIYIKYENINIKILIFIINNNIFLINIMLMDI